MSHLNIRQVIRSTLAALLLTGSLPFAAPADELVLPKPGSRVQLSQAFNPPVLKGLKVHPKNPFRFDFILDKGDEAQPTGGHVQDRTTENVSPSRLPSSDGLSAEATKRQKANALKQEANKLIKYFLASLTIPEKDIWVNLSPYEKDRIVPDAFGQTEMGRDLLAQDYLLKQITASLIYPEGEIGKAFWNKVYAEASKKYGTTQVPVNTFNKVWIMPEKAVVYENAKAGTAYVVESRLKVMLEQDYVALQHNRRGEQAKRVEPEDYLALSKNVIPATFGSTRYEGAKAGIHSKMDARQKHSGMTDELASQILRELVIPQLTKEVNEGKNFAQLRQVYNSLILANWYKKKIKDSILAQVYADKNKVEGVKYETSVIPERFSRESSLKNGPPIKAFGGDISRDDADVIYHRYLEAFKKGAYNYIKEEIDPATQRATPRKYFSGGVQLTNGFMDNAMVISTERSLVDAATGGAMAEIKVDLAMADGGAAVRVPVQSARDARKQVQLRSMLSTWEVEPDPVEILDLIRTERFTEADIRRAARSIDGLRSFASPDIAAAFDALLVALPYFYRMYDHVQKKYPRERILFAGRDGRILYVFFKVLAHLRGDDGSRFIQIAGSSEFYRADIMGKDKVMAAELLASYGVTKEAIERGDKYVLVDSGFRGSVGEGFRHAVSNVLFDGNINLSEQMPIRLVDAADMLYENTGYLLRFNYAEFTRDEFTDDVQIKALVDALRRDGFIGTELENPIRALNAVLMDSNFYGKMEAKHPEIRLPGESKALIELIKKGHRDRPHARLKRLMLDAAYPDLCPKSTSQVIGRNLQIALTMQRMPQYHGTYAQMMRHNGKVIAASRGRRSLVKASLYDETVANPDVINPVAALMVDRRMIQAIIRDEARRRGFAHGAGLQDRAITAAQAAPVYDASVLKSKVEHAVQDILKRDYPDATPMEVQADIGPEDLTLILLVDGRRVMKTSMELEGKHITAITKDSHFKERTLLDNYAALRITLLAGAAGWEDFEMLKLKAEGQGREFFASFFKAYGIELNADPKTVEPKKGLTPEFWHKLRTEVVHRETAAQRLYDFEKHAFNFPAWETVFRRAMVRAGIPGRPVIVGGIRYLFDPARKDIDVLLLGNESDKGAIGEFMAAFRHEMAVMRGVEVKENLEWEQRAYMHLVLIGPQGERVDFKVDVFSNDDIIRYKYREFLADAFKSPEQIKDEDIQSYLQWEYYLGDRGIFRQSLAEYRSWLRNDPDWRAKIRNRAAALKAELTPVPWTDHWHTIKENLSQHPAVDLAMMPGDADSKEHERLLGIVANSTADMHDRLNALDELWLRYSSLRENPIPESLKPKVIQGLSGKMRLLDQFVHGGISDTIIMLLALNSKLTPVEWEFLWGMFHRVNPPKSNRRDYLIQRGDLLARLLAAARQAGRDRIAILELGSRPQAQAAQRLKAKYGDRVDVHGIGWEADQAASPKGVTLHKGDFRHTDFADGQFDMVAEQYALGYFFEQEEYKAAVAEAMRVLKTGGVFVMSAWPFKGEKTILPLLFESLGYDVRIEPSGRNFLYVHKLSDKKLVAPQEQIDRDIHAWWTEYVARMRKQFRIGGSADAAMPGADVPAARASRPNDKAMNGDPAPPVVYQKWSFEGRNQWLADLVMSPQLGRQPFGLDLMIGQHKIVLYGVGYEGFDADPYVPWLQQHPNIKMIATEHLSQVFDQSVRIRDKSIVRSLIERVAPGEVGLDLARRAVEFEFNIRNGKVVETDVGTQDPSTGRKGYAVFAIPAGSILSIEGMVSREMIEARSRMFTELMTLIDRDSMRDILTGGIVEAETPLGMKWENGRLGFMRMDGVGSEEAGALIVPSLGRRLEQKGISFQALSDVDGLKTPEDSVSMVIASNVLPHMSNAERERLLSMLKRELRPDGIFLASQEFFERTPAAMHVLHVYKKTGGDIVYAGSLTATNAQGINTAVLAGEAEGLDETQFPPAVRKFIRSLRDPLYFHPVDFLLDAAMQATGQDKTGGIDLTSAPVDAPAHGNDGVIQFQLDPAQVERLRKARGFTPVIINIQPVADLRLFLGLNQEGNDARVPAG